MSHVGTPNTDPNAAPVATPDPAAAAPAASPAASAPEPPAGAPAAAPVVEPPAGDSVDPPAGGSPQTPAAGGDDPEPSDPAAKKDWKDRRIAKLTAQLHEARKGGAPAAPAPDPAAAPPGGLTQEDVLRQAEAIAAANDFNRRCNEVAAAGRGAFPDFNDRVGNLQHLYTPGNAAEELAYRGLLEAALETEDPARVLYELGGDMDKAEALMGMSPVKLGMEMAKLASKRSDPEPSAAPRPITPVGQRGVTHSEIDPADKAKADSLSTKTWMERRQAYIESQRKQGVRIA